jgi:hypothetical protein
VVYEFVYDLMSDGMVLEIQKPDVDESMSELGNECISSGFTGKQGVVENGNAGEVAGVGGHGGNKASVETQSKLLRVS